MVYDFDEDNTIPAVQRAIQEGDTRFHLVKNSVKRGVIGALLTGFRRVNDGPILVVMGDMSDDLQAVDKMLALYGQGFDLVAASRYGPVDVSSAALLSSGIFHGGPGAHCTSFAACLRPTRPTHSSSTTPKCCIQ